MFSPAVNRIGWLFIIFALYHMHCAGIKVTGGVGQGTRGIAYQYQPSNLRLPYRAENVIFKVTIGKNYSNSPVEAPLEYIFDALRTELEANGGRVFNAVVDKYFDIELKLIFSRYVTQKMYREYNTYIDCDLQITNTMSKENSLSPVSLSGSGNSSQAANRVAMGKLMQKVLLGQAAINLVGKVSREQGTEITQSLDKLSVNLLRDLQLKLQPGKRYNVALLEFKGVDGHKYSDIFTTSLTKHWPVAVFSFLTRTQLDALLTEHKLQMAGVLNENKILSFDQYDIADLIVTGTIIVEGKKILEVQVIETATARVLASQRSTI